MPELIVKPCANCNNPSTPYHTVKRCAKCKYVNYCNVASQKANWRAHKLVCSPTSDTLATFKEVLLEDGQMELDQLITVSRDSFVLKSMQPTSELSLGYENMIMFPNEWLASITHSPAAEQDKAKAEYATKKDEAEVARMTPERREAERRHAQIFGEIQENVNARLAEKDAAKNAARKSGNKSRTPRKHKNLQKPTRPRLLHSPAHHSTPKNQPNLIQNPSPDQPTQPQHHVYYFMRQLQHPEHQQISTKLCGACKTVGYCNRACQKAHWKAHNPSCHQLKATGDKHRMSEAALRNINETIASLEATAEHPYAFGPAETFTIPEDSCYLQLPPTPELPRGSFRLIHFPAEFMAGISSLSQEEQERARDDFITQMLATEEANTTPEMREEERLEAAKAGKLQAEFFEKLAAKEARDAERK